MTMITTKSRRFIPIHRQYLVMNIVSIVAVAWAITATIAFLRQKPKTVLIGIDQNGTRVIESRMDPLFETEVVNFIRNFVQLYYSYESETFLKQVGEATEYFSENLWKRNEEQLSRQTESLKKESLSQITVLKTIEQLSVEKPKRGVNTDGGGSPMDLLRGKYHVTGEINISARLRRWMKGLDVQLSLRRVPRTERNPWGFVIDELEDKIVDSK